MDQEKEKSAGKLLEEQLTWKFPHIGKKAPEQTEEAATFCEGYKEFLNQGKTERECVAKAVEMLEAAGYRPLSMTEKYRPGDKVYLVNRQKSILATTFGEEPLNKGVRINGAHIDSPRLDLKPYPFENPLLWRDPEVSVGDCAAGPSWCGGEKGWGAGEDLHR